MRTAQGAVLVVKAIDNELVPGADSEGAAAEGEGATAEGEGPPARLDEAEAEGAEEEGVRCVGGGRRRRLRRLRQRTTADSDEEASEEATAAAAGAESAGSASEEGEEGEEGSASSLLWDPAVDAPPQQSARGGECKLSLRPSPCGPFPVLRWAPQTPGVVIDCTI